MAKWEKKKESPIERCRPNQDHVLSPAARTSLPETDSRWPTFNDTSVSGEAIRRQAMATVGLTYPRDLGECSWK